MHFWQLRHFYWLSKKRISLKPVGNITNIIDQENSSLLFIFYRSMITCLMLRKQNLPQSLSSRYLVEHVDFRLHVKILPLLPIKPFNTQDLTLRYLAHICIFVISLKKFKELYESISYNNVCKMPNLKDKPLESISPLDAIVYHHLY